MLARKSGLLFTAALLPFLPLLGAELVNWDDDYNLTDNYAFRLGWRSVKWAFLTPHLGEYRPFAWLLWQLQYALWKLSPAGYHAVSLVAHGLTVAVVASVLWRLCRRWAPEKFNEGAFFPFALAVFFFAVHPLRAEVVAWISIQSYLPSALFALLALHFHSERPWSRKAALCLLVSLLFKPVAVTLPAVFLLVDWYEKRTLRADKSVWVRRTDFFLMSAAFAALAIWAKARAGALEMLGESGLWERIAHAAYGLCFYLAKTVYPFGLSVSYRAPEGSAWHHPVFLVCVPLAIGLTALLIVRRKRHPAWLALWGTYCVLLAPNLGLVKSGYFLAADRYGYLPLIVGVLPLAHLFRALDLKAKIPFRATAGAVLLGLAVLTWQRCLAWKDSVSLWTREIEGGRPGIEAFNNLGAALNGRDRPAEAEPLLRRALDLYPHYSPALDNLGVALDKQGHLTEAIQYFEQAIVYDAANAPALLHLGDALVRQGSLEEGIEYLNQALRVRPEYPLALRKLGAVLSNRGDQETAQAHLAEADRLERL